MPSENQHDVTPLDAFLGRHLRNWHRAASTREEVARRAWEAGAEAARAQDVAWLRECEERAISKDTRAAFHNAADGIEQGWAFLSRNADEAIR